mmetsp:Transcript_22963/g.44735  ORF Transcript_22963/g.44735 Transcript_22963/m.44735 type:complete len:728 (+) Transcript_22963:761-2944(+)
MSSCFDVNVCFVSGVGSFCSFLAFWWSCSALSSFFPESLQGVVKAVGGLELVLATELDATGCLDLENAAPGPRVGVHFDEKRRYLRVHHDPCTTSERGVRRQVDRDRLPVGHESINDVGSELEHLVEHVAHSAREASPVSEDDQRKVFAVHVLDGLGGLKRRVRVPHLARLRHHDLLGVRSCGIGWVDLLHHVGSDGDHTHRHAPEPGPPGDDRLRPSFHQFHERALVEEARNPLARSSLSSGGCPRDEVLRVVGSLGRDEVHLSLHGIRGGHAHQLGLVLLVVVVVLVALRDPGGARAPLERELVAPVARHVREPLEALRHPVEVVLAHHVGDAVVVHHVDAAQLVVRRVHLPPQELVEREVPREEDGRAGPLLHDALPQPRQVGTDTHRATTAVRQREDLVVRDRRLSRDQTRATEVLHAQPVALADDVIDAVADGLGLIVLDPRARHGVLESLVVFLREEQVRRALGDIVLVPRDLEPVHQLLREPDPRPRVDREVQPRDPPLARAHRGEVEEDVLQDPERPRLRGDLVGDEDDVPPLGVEGRAEGHLPGDHGDVVLAHATVRLHELPVLQADAGDAVGGFGGVFGREHELLHSHDTLLRGCQSGVGPFLAQSDLEEGDEVVGVDGSHALGSLPLLLEGRVDGVWSVDSLAIEVAFGGTLFLIDFLVVLALLHVLVDDDLVPSGVGGDDEHLLSLGVLVFEGAGKLHRVDRQLAEQFRGVSLDQ